jgi:hypothetical protein
MIGGIRAANTQWTSVGATVAVPPNTPFKSTFGWSSASAVEATNGTLSGVDTSVVLPTVSKLMFAQPAVFQGASNIWIAKLSYYPQRLIDAEVQAFSK